MLHDLACRLCVNASFGDEPRLRHAAGRLQGDVCPKNVRAFKRALMQVHIFSYCPRYVARRMASQGARNIIA